MTEGYEKANAKALRKKRGLFWSRCIDCGTLQSNDVRSVIRAVHELSGTRSGQLYRKVDEWLESGSRMTGDVAGAELVRQRSENASQMLPCVACRRPLIRSGAMGMSLYTQTPSDPEQTLATNAFGPSPKATAVADRVAAAESTSTTSRKRPVLKGIGISFGVLAIIGMIADQEESENAESAENIPSSSVPSSSEPAASTLPSTTTTTIPTLSVSDLPVVADPAGNVDAIKVLQALLDASCCATTIDGRWGQETQASLDTLNDSLGTAAAGLDAELWEEVLSRSLLIIDGNRSTPIQGLSVPAQAIPLPSTDPSKYSYILAGSTTGTTVTEWFVERYEGTDLPGWSWCTRRSLNDLPRFLWWNESDGMTGPLLELNVRDSRAGRVDITVSTTQGNLRDCAGYSPPPTTTTYRASSNSLTVSSDRYRYQDYGLSWQWRPTGTYENRSPKRIIYSEVVWTISLPELGISQRYFESIEDEIPAGGSISIMDNKWFTLDIYDPKQSLIGLELGGGSIVIFPEVRYIMFEDYTEYGIPY